MFTNGLGEYLAKQRNKLECVDSLSPIVAIRENQKMSTPMANLGTVEIPTPIEVDSSWNHKDIENKYPITCEICSEYAAYHFIKSIEYWVCDQCNIDISNYKLPQAN